MTDTETDKTGTKTEINKKRFLDALSSDESSGMVSKAADLTGLSRSQYYHWCAQDQEFAINAGECITIGRDKSMDFIEEALMKLIESGNVQAIIFAAKTRLRTRGYGEHQVVENSTQEDTIISIESE